MELVPALRKSINDEGQTLGSSKIKSQIEGDGFSFLLFFTRVNNCLGARKIAIKQLDVPKLTYIL